MAELTAAQEANVQAAVQAAYAAWLPLVQQRVLAAYNRFGAAPDPGLVPTTAGVWHDQLRQLDDEALEQVAQEQYAEEGGDGKIDMTGVLMAAAATATFFFLAAAVTEVAAHLAGIVFSSPDRNQQVAKIKAYLDPSQPHWKAKAQQLAVSEGNRWAQAASLTAISQVASKTKALYQKIWVTRDDSRVRAAHASADGQRRPIRAPFNVGGFPMMHPMDPAAPPSLVVNCRCWMRFEKGAS